MSEQLEKAMLASEMIERLRAMIEEHGDLEVFINDWEYPNYKATVIRFFDGALHDSAPHKKCFLVE